MSNEPSPLDSHCLHSVVHFGLKHLFTTIDGTIFGDGKVHFINSGVKGLTVIILPNDAATIGHTSGRQCDFRLHNMY